LKTLTKISSEAEQFRLWQPRVSWPLQIANLSPELADTARHQIRILLKCRIIRQSMNSRLRLKSFDIKGLAVDDFRQGIA